MKDALLLIDVLNDLCHEDGDKLLDSFRERHADACATTNPEIERLALEYAETIVGARVDRSGS